MRTTVLALGAILAGASIASAQTTISQWTFETSPPADLTDSAIIFGIYPDIGNNGVLSGVHAGSATDWSTPAGNGSANSLSANNWAPGDYYQFQFGGSGLTDISVSFDHTSSSTGPRDFIFSYSIDGSFIDFANYSVLANAAPNPVWNSTTSTNIYTQNFDLSAISALDNRVIEFRIATVGTTSASGGTVGAGGTSRIDNLTVRAVPEPSMLTLVALGAGGLLVRRFRRQA